MIRLENEFYIRFILLLIKGGTEVLREIVNRGLKRQNVSLHDFLKANKVQICSSKQITKLQRDVLYPPTPNCSDVSKWDISLLSYIALDCMSNDLNGVEKRAVEKVRNMRNEVHAHSTTAEIEPRKFTQIWNELSLVITTLSHTMSDTEREKLNNLISSLSSGQLDIYAAIEELKLLERRDEFFECIQTSLEDIQQSQAQLTVAVCNYHQDVVQVQTTVTQGLLELKKQIFDLTMSMENRGENTKIVNTMFGRVKVSAEKQVTVDTAESVLLSASVNSVKKSVPADTLKVVKDNVDRFVEDVEGTGVKVDSVEKGSVLFTFTCSSLEAVLDLIEYFQSNKIQKRMDDIAKSLENMVGYRVELSADILKEPLLNIIKKLVKKISSGLSSKRNSQGQLMLWDEEKTKEHRRTLKFSMTCRGVEGLQHAWNIFEGGAASNSLNSLSKALSDTVGEPIRIETSIDIEQMQKAIKLTKEQLDDCNGDSGSFDGQTSDRDHCRERQNTLHESQSHQSDTAQIRNNRPQRHKQSISRSHEQQHVNVYSRSENTSSFGKKRYQGNKILQSRDYLDQYLFQQGGIIREHSQAIHSYPSMMTESPLYLQVMMQSMGSMYPMQQSPNTPPGFVGIDNTERQQGASTNQHGNMADETNRKTICADVDGENNKNQILQGCKTGRSIGRSHRKKQLLEKPKPCDEFNFSLGAESCADDVYESVRRRQKRIVRDIRLDDIFEMSLQTLRNRLKKDKENLAKMRKLNQDEDELMNYKISVMKIERVLEDRTFLEKQERGDEKRYNRSKPKEYQDVQTHYKKDATSYEDDAQENAKGKQIQINRKRLPTTVHVLGRTSFKPQTDVTKTWIRKKNRRKKVIDEYDTNGNEFKELCGTDISSRPGQLNYDQQQPKKPDVDDVFEFMVKTLAGNGLPEQIRKESNLFPIDCNEMSWFRKCKRHFKLIERNGTIENVLVFNRDATYCLHYVTSKSCKKEDCKRYHICKQLLAGNCDYGDGCKFSHDFLDERNASISKLLGYSNVFNSDEICSILRVRYPHICHNWIDHGACDDLHCISLHMCPRYILDQCLQGKDCPLIHDKCSDHNKPIVNAYGMANWDENMFKQIIYLKRQPSNEAKEEDETSHEDSQGVATTFIYKNERRGSFSKRQIETEKIAHGEDTDCEAPLSGAFVTCEGQLLFNYVNVKPDGTAQGVSSKPIYSREKLNTFDKELLKTEIQEDIEDSAIETPLCERYLTKQCTGQGCRLLHCKKGLPYIWQVKLCSDWINLKQLEDIEQAYCNNQEFSEEICLVHNDLEFSVVVIFRPRIRAIAIVIGTEDGGTHTEARRLSTMSYKEGTSNPDSFKTQWRWYLMDDYSKGLLFVPDAVQHTLEVKFLAKQREFNYSRENYRFKYILDFNEMTQRNIDTRKLRQISRRPLFVSQNDVKGKHYPKSLTAAPVVETPLPQSWVPWDLAFPFELVRIDESDPKYTQVSDSFFKTLDRGQIEIDTIFRMQNPKLWNLYYNQEKIMEANLKRLGKETSVDKRYLFHGADSMDAVRGISINNFDARVSGKTVTMYGDGAYFARDAKYSHSYTKGPDRFMFMVTVLVGQYTKGDKSYNRPPNKPGYDQEMYDSCVDDINKPSLFIAFDKNQYYPEFLIQYHKLYEESDDTQHVGTVPQTTAHEGTSEVRQHGEVGGANVSTMKDTTFCCIQ